MIDLHFLKADFSCLMEIGLQGAEEVWAVRMEAGRDHGNSCGKMTEIWSRVVVLTLAAHSVTTWRAFKNPDVQTN